jgi:hypothetical protein
MAKKVKSDPFKIAREAIAETKLATELSFQVHTSLEPNALNKVYRAINPKIDQIEKRYNQIQARADSQDHQLRVDFDDVWLSRAITWQDAAFALGIAFALRLKGGSHD